MNGYFQTVDNLVWEREPDMAAVRAAYDLMKSAPAEALDRLRALAERGSLMSMAYLGDAYERGVGTKVSLVQAQEWYSRAAQAGSVFGSYKLGRCYFRLKDYAKAADAFKVGASRDYMPCVTQLARMHLRGQGVPRDVSKALDYLEKASARGYAFAKHDLAVLLIRGARGPVQRLRGIYLYFAGFKDIFLATVIDKSEERLR